MTIKIWAAGAAAVVLAVGLAGCGGSSSSSSTTSTEPATTTLSFEDIALASNTKAENAGSARMTMVMNMMGAEMTAEGAFELTDSGPALDVVYDMSAFGEAVGDDSATLGTFGFRVVDDGVYMTDPTGMLGADTWISLTDEMSAMLGMDLGDMVEQFEQQATDPTSGLAALGDAVEVEEDGTGVVDGEDVTWYALSVDLGAAAGLVEELGGQLSDLDGIDGLGEMDARYAIGTDGLPRVMEMTIETEMGTMETTATYSDWGQPMNITAPTPDQIVDLSDLEGMFDSDLAG